MNSKESQSFKGYWHLPEDKENKIAGILEIINFKSFKLDLIGGFDNTLESFLIEESKEKVIFGEVYDDENNFWEISLINCFSSRRLNFSATHILTKYNCTYFIKGKHIKSINDKLFNSLTAKLSNLNKFKPSSSIVRKIEYNNEIESLSIKIKRNESNTIETKILKNTTLSLIDYSFFYEKNGENIIGQYTLMKLEYTDKKSLKEILNNLITFKDFISLALLSNNSFKNISLVSDEDYQLSKGKKHFDDIEFQYVSNNDIDEYKNDNRLFSYSDIVKEYPTIIYNWYNLDKSFSLIKEYLLDSIKLTTLFHPNNFLNIIQAIEGYDKRFLSKEENYPKKRKLIEMLTYLVRNKFKEINKLSQISDNDLKKIVDSRHHFSHLLDNDKGLFGQDLYNLTNKTKIILIVCVLSLIGLENKTINKLLKDTY